MPALAPPDKVLGAHGLAEVAAAGNIWLFVLQGVDSIAKSRILIHSSMRLAVASMYRHLVLSKRVRFGAAGGLVANQMTAATTTRKSL